MVSHETRHLRYCDARPPTQCAATTCELSRRKMSVTAARASSDDDDEEEEEEGDDDDKGEDGAAAEVGDELAA